MDFLDKISTFILQSTHSLQSWRTVLTNCIAIGLVFMFRNTISAFCVTLSNMNYNVDTVIFWLSAITAYALIYRSVCAVASACSRFYSSRKAAHAKALNISRIKQNLCSLSKQEISTLKFLLLQPDHAAWLPAQLTATVLLRQKGFINPLGKHIKTICDNNKSFQEALSHAVLFTIPRDIANLLQEHSKAWRNVQPDNSLHRYQ